MKTMVLSSSASSSRTPSSAIRNQSDGRGGGGGGSDSCYFPGCRKDTNCHCDICLASINATRDLLQQSSLSKISALRFPPKKIYPPSDPDNPPTTPEPVSYLSAPFSPRIKTTTKSRPSDKSRSSSSVIGYRVLMVLVGFLLFLAVDSGFLVVILKGLGPKLMPKMVREFGEEARVLKGDLKGRLGILEKKIEGVVGIGGVSNCSSVDSIWKLNQEGHHFFFQWRCVIYQSMAEEVSIWGSPLRTSGVLSAGSSSRSLTLLSGRITEWSEMKLMPTSRTSNGSSWTLGKWSLAAVQMEGETWVLEYQRSALFQGSGLIQTTWEILRLRVQRMLQKLKWKLLLSRRALAGTHCSTSREQQFKHPT